MNCGVVRRLSRFLVCSMLVCLVLVGTGMGDLVETKERTVTQLVPGVYAVRHKDAPSGFPNSNTTVIIGEREVLVVDSCYLPSEARADIAQIRQWTNKPVRYLLNTHWHNDHVGGNTAYAEAFPGITIIAQTETAVMMQGYVPKSIERYPTATVTMKRNLESGTNEAGKPLTDAEKTEMKSELPGRYQVEKEFQGLVVRMPDVTFERELALNLGNREVQIRYMGHGNTSGDAVVFLPKEKILITGDIVVHPVPYLCSGYPYEWSQTLQRMIDLGPQIIVPGHGEVQHGTAYMSQVKDLLITVVTQVRSVFYTVGNGAQLDEVQKQLEQSLDFEALRRQFDGGVQANFSQSAVISKCLPRDAYYEEKLR